MVAGAAAVTVYGLPYRLNIVAAIAVAVAVCLLLEPYSRIPPRRPSDTLADGEQKHG